MLVLQPSETSDARSRGRHALKNRHQLRSTVYTVRVQSILSVLDTAISSFASVVHRRFYGYSSSRSSNILHGAS